MGFGAKALSTPPHGVMEVLESLVEAEHAYLLNMLKSHSTDSGKGV
jgi:hypothetical protein